MTASRGLSAGIDSALDLHDNLVGDVLVLASVISSVEGRLVDEWLARQKRQRPNRHIPVLRLPRGEPPPSVITRLAKQLSSAPERRFPDASTGHVVGRRILRAWAGWVRGVGRLLAAAG